MELFEEMALFLEGGRHTVREALAHFSKSPDWYYRWKGKKERGELSDMRGWKKGEPRKYGAGLADDVCAARDLLEGTQTFWDAQAVHSELRRKASGGAVPSVHYVKRILHDMGKTKGRYSSRTADERTYPTGLFPACVLRIGVDLWGPKTVKGSAERAVAACLSFLGAEKAMVPLADASAGQLLDAEWRFLRETGRVPFYVLSDNGAQMLGNTDCLPDFGRHLRLWMNLGVVPVFVPESQPWRNGVAESVNGVWKAKYWGRKKYVLVSHVHDDMRTFSRHMSERHVAAGQVPPLGCPTAEPSLERLGRSASADGLARRLAPDASPYVLFIRPVRHDEDAGQSFFSMPGGRVPMERRWIGTYVVAVVDVRKQRLTVWYEEEAGVFTRIAQRPFKCSI